MAESALGSLVTSPFIVKFALFFLICGGFQFIRFYLVNSGLFDVSLAWNMVLALINRN